MYVCVCEHEYVYVYVCVCVHGSNQKGTVYVCVHEHGYVYVCVFVCMCPWLQSKDHCVCMCVYMSMGLYVCVYVYVYAYNTRTCIHTIHHAYTRTIHTHMHACIYTYQKYVLPEAITIHIARHVDREACKTIRLFSY
jgi:hypothetical protein